GVTRSKTKTGLRRNFTSSPNPTASYSLAKICEHRSVTANSHPKQEINPYEAPLINIYTAGITMAARFNRGGHQPAPVHHYPCLNRSHSTLAASEGVPGGITPHCYY